MAVVYFVGAGNDGNWNTGANWSTGAVPQNSDTALIGATNQNLVAATVAQTGLTIVFTPGYGGNVEGLTITNGGTLLRYAGTGASARFLSGGTFTAASLEHSGNQNVELASGTWTTVNNGMGGLLIGASAVVTTLNNTAGTVTAQYNATVFTTCSNAGTMVSYRSATTLNCKRGSYILLDNGTTTYTLSTTVNIENGAVYNKRSGGTDVTLNLFPGGTFTPAGTSGGSGNAITITTANIWTGSTYIENVPGVTVTTTTKNYVGPMNGSR